MLINFLNKNVTADTESVNLNFSSALSNFNILYKQSFDIPSCFTMAITKNGSCCENKWLENTEKYIIVFEF